MCDTGVKRFKNLCVKRGIKSFVGTFRAHSVYGTYNINFILFWLQVVQIHGTTFVWRWTSTLFRSSTTEDHDTSKYTLGRLRQSGQIFWYSNNLFLAKKFGKLSLNLLHLFLPFSSLKRRMEPSPCPMSERIKKPTLHSTRMWSLLRQRNLKDIERKPGSRYLWSEVWRLEV